MKMSRSVLLMLSIMLAPLTLTGCKENKKKLPTLYEYGSIESLVFSEGHGAFEVTYETKAMYNEVFDKEDLVKKAFKKANLFTKVDEITPKTDKYFTYLGSYVLKIENDIAYYHQGSLTVYADGNLALEVMNDRFMPDNFYYTMDASIAEEANTIAENKIREAKQCEDSFLEFASIENIISASKKQKLDCHCIYYQNGFQNGGRIDKKDNEPIISKISEATFVSCDDDAKRAEVYLSNNRSIIYDYSPEKDGYTNNGNTLFSYRIEIHEEGYVFFSVHGKDKLGRLYYTGYSDTFYSIGAEKAQEILNFVKG